jgi:hypothetical protein
MASLAASNAEEAPSTGNAEEAPLTAYEASWVGTHHSVAARLAGTEAAR